MTTLSAKEVTTNNRLSEASYRRFVAMYEIGKLYLATHYGPAPLTAAEVQDHAEKLRELGRLCREIGGGK